MSDTVHCHLYVTHSHPNRAIHKKKYRKTYRMALRKSKKVKNENLPCIALICLIAFMCTCVYLSVYAQASHICDFVIEACSVV